MQKVELSKVLDLLIAEDREEAGKLLHEWFVGKSKSILEELMQEDDGALDEIEDAKEEIASEEYYGDVDLDEAGDDEVDGGEEVVDGEVEGDLEGAGDEIEAAADDLGAELGAEEVEVPVEDKVEDLEAQLASLKAEFDKLMGGDVDAGMDAGIEGDDEFVGDEVADVDVVGDDEFAAEGVFESDEDDSDDEKLEESEEELDEDFQDLEESFELEKVADPKLRGEGEIGDGGSIAVSKDSPIPQRKTGDRVGGAVVEIKGKTHKGYAREASPGVNAKPILKNQVSNAKQDLTPVTPEGDKSALINKGPKEDKGKSPIGGGAVDLRGDDMKRK
ncbi:hypothetical protein D3C87_628490 [compost metagenome]